MELNNLSRFKDISNHQMSPEQSLLYASMERAVELMYWLFWLFDVNFEEDLCLMEDRVLQQYFNMFYKAAINLIKFSYQE